MSQIIQEISRLPLWSLILLSGIWLVVGDLFAKQWSEDQKISLFILAILSYVLYGIFFIPSLLKDGLIVTALSVILINILGFLFIGLVIFKETLSPVQIVGLILGIISVILLEV